MGVRVPRKRGNSAQEEALDKLLSALIARGFMEVRHQYKTVIAKPWLLVKLDLPDFPIIRIGGRGGFEMIEISTHPPPRDNIAANAFEACVWGDKYAQRQGRGAAKDSPYRDLGWESP
jgi:hypothetical protein